jgi:hypothetical protein
MLVVGMGYDLRVMTSVVVAEDLATLADIRVSIVHTNRISQFRADNLVKIKIGVIPKESPAADQPVVIIRRETSNRLCDPADLAILTQAALKGCEVVVNGHAAIDSRCMNWRIGSEVK